MGYPHKPISMQSNRWYRTYPYPLFSCRYLDAKSVGICLIDPSITEPWGSQGFRVPTVQIRVSLRGIPLRWARGVDSRSSMAVLFVELNWDLVDVKQLYSDCHWRSRSLLPMLCCQGASTRFVFSPLTVVLIRKLTLCTFLQILDHKITLIGIITLEGVLEGMDIVWPHSLGILMFACRAHRRRDLWWIWPTQPGSLAQSIYPTRFQYRSHWYYY